MIEALEQARAAAREQPAVDAVAEAVDVEERQREQEAIGRAVMRQASTRLRALAARLPCVMTAPFAVPVVPDV